MATLYALLARIYPSGIPAKTSDYPSELVLEAVDLDTMSTQASISLGDYYVPSYPQLAVSPAHQRVFVADGDVRVFDPVGGLIGTVPGMGRDIALSPDESVLYVRYTPWPPGSPHGVKVLDTQQLTVVGQVDTPYANFMSLSSDGGTIALLGGGSLEYNFWLVDTATLTVTDAVVLPYEPKQYDHEKRGLGFAPDRNMFLILGVRYFQGHWLGGVQLPGLQTAPKVTGIGDDHDVGVPGSRFVYSDQSSKVYIPWGSASYFDGSPIPFEKSVFEVEPGVSGVAQIGGLQKVSTIPCIDESHEVVFFAMRPPWPPQLQPQYVVDLPHTLGRYLVNFQQFDEDVYSFSRPDLSVLAMQVVGKAPYEPADPLPPPDLRRVDPDQWKLLVTILVGVTQGGGGVAITPGGKIIPIDPPPYLEDLTSIERALRAAKIAQAAEDHPVPEMRRQIQERALEVVARELEKAGVRVERTRTEPEQRK